MILTHHKPFFYLSDFGINVPLGDRILKILDHLKKQYSNKIYYDNDFKGQALTKNDLLLAHSEEFVDQLFSEKIIDVMSECFELDQYGVDNANVDFTKLRDMTLIQGYYTYRGMKLAHENGFCYFLGGGMHHAMSSSGRGFCLVNDMVIGARKLFKEEYLKNVWVIDLDAHKGDGTSELTKNDERISTLSIHMKDGWPLAGAHHDDPVMIPSTVDIPVAKGTEKLYLAKLEEGLNQLKELSKNKPDLAIIVDGADPYKLDELPGTFGIQLTKSKMLKRDKLVYKFLKGNNIPQLYVMGGGYGKYVGDIYIQFLDYLLKEHGLE